jgi:hypothetical protein
MRGGISAYFSDTTPIKSAQQKTSRPASPTFALMARILLNWGAAGMAGWRFLPPGDGAHEED